MGYTTRNQSALASMLKRKASSMGRSGWMRVDKHSLLTKKLVFEITGPNGQRGRVTSYWHIDYGKCCKPRLGTAFVEVFK